MNNEVSHCGYVAIIGRPNVGKSTLLNKILGQKLSITSHKPQTTRYQILGIKNYDAIQVIYVDTPGLHRKIKHTFNRYLNRVAQQALNGVDVIAFMVDALRWTSEDEWILNKIKKLPTPVILLVNKVDTIQSKETLLPWIEEINKKRPFTAVIPLSAKTGENLKSFEQEIIQFLPEGPHLFPDDQLTDRSDRFLAAEIIREKLTRYLHQELPYDLTVEIEEFKTKKKILHISAVIWLARAGQKAIVIGEKGAGLKMIGQRSRLELEKLFGQKIFLTLWTKVKENWSDDIRALKSLGYTDV